MSANHEVKAPQPHPAKKRFFTLEEANRSLPYVARIVSDIRAAYRTALDLQHRVEFPVPGDDVDAVQTECQKIVETLNGYVDELRQVGVELKDYNVGLIDFPAMHEGREVCLCWKHGEDRIVAWHETGAGFAGRQDISKLTVPAAERK